MKNGNLTTSDILVVDDNPADLTILRAILTNHGYHVRAAISGDLALKSVSNKAPDLILSDIKMPGINGYQFCERLKGNPDPDICNIPLIFISALNEVVDRVTALACGGVDFIAKPFEQEEVLARIETHLKLRQTQKELEEKNVLLHQEISQRKHAQHSLQESQRALATLMSNLPGMAYRCLNDSDWTMLFVSEGCLALTGYQADGLVNNQVIGYGQLIHPDDQQMVWETVQTAVQNNKPFTATYRLLTRDGEEKWVWEQGQQVLAAGHDLPILEGFISDITQQIQAEKSLQESLAKWESLVQHASYFIAIMDREGILQFVNQLQPGFQLEDVIGTSNFDYIDPQYHALVREKVKKVFDSGQTVIYELEGVGEKGAKTWYETRVSPLILDDKVAYVTMISLDITDRKQAEKALLDSESRFRSLVEQSPFSTSLYSPDGYLVYGNPASTEIFNISAEDLEKLYQTYNVLADQQLVNQGQMPFIQKGFAGEFTEVPPVQHDMGQLNPALADRSRWLQSFIYPVKNEDGEIKEVALIHEDITEQIETSAKIRQSEERYRAVVETANDGIITIDEQGDVVSWNRGAEIIFGYTADEMNGRAVATIMPAEFRELHQNSMAQVVNTGKSKMVSKTIQLTGLRKDGSEFPLELSLARWEADEKIFFTSIVRDITKRVRVKEALQESQQNLNLLVDNIIDVVWQTDLRLNFTYVSPSVFPLTGYTQEEWVGTNLSQHATGKEFFKMGRKALSAIKNYKEIKHINFEANLLKKNGETFPVEIVSKLMFNQKGLPIGLQGTTRDITERKRAEEALRQSESRLSVVFNNTSDLQLLWAVESDGEIRVLSVNNTYIEAAKSFGIDVSREDIVGKSLSELGLLLGLDQDTKDFLVKKYKKAIESSEILEYPEIVAIGTGTYHAEIMLIPIADRNGRCQFVLYNSHNVTELKEAADALEKLNIELDERVRVRTDDLNRTVQLMAGREVRMAELKKVINKLRNQLEDAGLNPVANDPLLES